MGNNPTVQASLSANTFAISGHGEEKHFTDLLPNILNHLGADGFNQIKRHASSMAQAAAADDDEVPELVEGFEAASKAEPEKKLEKGEDADDEEDKAEKPKAKKTSKKNQENGGSQ